MMRLDEDIRRAMDARLSGLTACEERRAGIRRRIAREGEKPMKRKMTAGMAIALALMLVCAAALAAGLGLFGQLGERENTDARLSALDGVAAQVNRTTVTEDGVTAVIRQAYYDGSRLFVSYELSGALYTMETGDGWPEGVEWTNEQPGVIFSRDCADEENLLNMKLAAWLDGSAPRWAKVHLVEPHDGLFLEDGTYLDIIGGEEIRQADGTVIGWKECEVPSELAEDSLEAALVLFRSETLYGQDKDSLKIACTRGGTTRVSFRAEKAGVPVSLTGSGGGEDWSAQAHFSLTPVDVKGELRLTCPESWRQALESWNMGSMDMVYDWVLLEGEGANGISPLDEGVANTEDGMCYTLCFRTGGGETLRLAPVYSQSGIHPEEAIALEAK